MSGGSMDYLYEKVRDARFVCNSPERKAFKKHLELVVKALHDIEWVDSFDYGKGDEEEAILACLNKHDVLMATISTALLVLDDLEKQINNAKKLLA